MKIINESAEIITPQKIEGSKKFEFTLHLNNVKGKSDDKLSEKIRRVAGEFSNEFVSKSYVSVANLIEQLENSDDSQAKSFLSCLKSSETCTYVYWGCGSCSGGRARVDAYCDGGGGGSQPDYSRCESC
ncbi:hypothetical protein [uncultured Croceitalea sp.]|uniref:hypothetical protein n=1 Tax=uncultured Croceitalea sp. TaxID=1798908 RepID=UPI00374E9480